MMQSARKRAGHAIGKSLLEPDRLELAADVRELDINPLVVRPRGAVALDALILVE